MSTKILEAVDKLRDHKMTEDEVAEQRISFAYGNTSSDDNSTKEEVRAAVMTSTVPAN